MSFLKISIDGSQTIQYSPFVNPNIEKQLEQEAKLTFDMNAQNKRITKIEAARQIREAAKAWRALSKDPYSKKYDISDVYVSDAANLRELAKMVRAGKLQDARKYADLLDTVVREVIPFPAWDFIQDDA